MKKFKRITALFFALIMILCVTACDSAKPDKEGSSEDSDINKTYDAMMQAAEKGDYAKALEYYNNGAARADDPDVLNWYFYSMAMNDYEKKGCIGYSLDLLQNKVDESFEQSDEKMGLLQMSVRDFNGVYSGNGNYLYFADGKVAISEMVQIVDSAPTNGEIVKQNDVYYWAEHHADGDDTLLYSITFTATGLELTAVEGAESAMYAGVYTLIQAEMPVLFY